MLRIPDQRMTLMHTCPLCEQHDSRFFYEDKRRPYYQCQCCALVFVPQEYLLDAEAEKAHYDLHENDPLDAGYRRFLSRTAEPLLERLAPHSKGLDFGCGPGPALAMMLQEAGHEMALYDVYFHPDRSVLAQRYDFVTATEVIEHLYQPNQIWQQWLNLVKPGGWLGVMTKLVKDVEAFASWHYKNDITHVCFYSQETFNYLAQRDNLQIEFIGNDVILLRKPQ
jgi:SAM-dependent methyltransferase